jgi:hypothetical protein
MSDKSDRNKVTLERLLRAQAAIAYAMTLDGPVYGPIFERLEREISTMRAADDVMDRARRCLETRAAPAPVTKAIGWRGKPTEQAPAKQWFVCAAQLTQLLQPSPRLLQAK